MLVFVLEKIFLGKKCRVGWGGGWGEILGLGCERPQTLTTLCWVQEVAMHYAFFYSLLPEPRFLLQGDNMLQEIAVLLQVLVHALYHLSPWVLSAWPLNNIRIKHAVNPACKEMGDICSGHFNIDVFFSIIVNLLNSNLWVLLCKKWIH